MTHIHGLDRGQLLLLPEAIDDYVAADNPVRFIDAFVEGLDLRVAGFERVETKAISRPGYAPGDLLMLYIYGSGAVEPPCPCRKSNPNIVMV
jgi:transposase